MSVVQSKSSDKNFNITKQINRANVKSIYSTCGSSREPLSGNIFLKLLLDSIKFLIILYRSVNIFFKSIYYYMTLKFKSSVKSSLQLAQIKSRIQVPHGIAVILNEEHIDERKLYDLLALITDVFSKLGIKTLIFYQYKGFSNHIEENLRYNFEKNVDVNNNQIIKEKEITDLTKRKIANKIMASNQIVTDDENMDISLKFLSNSNGGRDILVHTCRDIVKELESNKINLQTVDKQFIDKKIKDISSFEEPELIISIGSSDTIAGYSPWHMRLTEIIKIPSSKLINQNTLVGLLSRYAKIEKRVGK